MQITLSSWKLQNLPRNCTNWREENCHDPKHHHGDKVRSWTDHWHCHLEKYIFFTLSRFSQVVKSTKLRLQSRIKKYLKANPPIVCLYSISTICIIVYLYFKYFTNFYIILQIFFTPSFFPVCVDASQAKQLFAVENLWSLIVQSPCLLSSLLSRFINKSSTFPVLLGPLFEPSFLFGEFPNQSHPYKMHEK